MKTAKQHNQQLMGETEVFSTVSSLTNTETMPSGMIQQMAWAREAERRKRISEVLGRFLQDQTLIEAIVTAILADLERP